MDELRWILLGIGLLILTGIYFFADPTAPARKPEPDEHEEFDPAAVADGSGLDEDVPDEDMERELERLGELISEERRAELAGAGAHGQAGPALDSEPEKIVALFLRAQGSGRLQGPEIVSAAEKVGLDYGDMGIFHRLQESGDQNVAVFSMADMMSPGSFDLDRIHGATTSGLCLFLTLPNPLTALDAWDAMLATGQRLADLLEVELLDDSHSSLSRQRIAHIREEMREYDRRSEFHLNG